MRGAGDAVFLLSSSQGKLMNLAIVAVIAVLVGYIAGATLATALASEARHVEGRLMLEVNAVREDARRYALSVAQEVSRVEADVEAKHAQLEKDVKESFDVSRSDIADLGKYVETVANNQAVAVAHVLAPDAKRA